MALSQLQVSCPLTLQMESIQVTWDPPRRPNGTVQSYLLYIDEQGQDTFVELDLSGDATSYGLWAHPAPL